MTSQLGRHYRSPARPWPGDLTPPAPGQAHFGYPQPSRQQPSRQQPNHSAAEQIGVPAQARRPSDGPNTAAPVTRPTPILRPVPPIPPSIGPAAPLPIGTAYFSTQPRPYRAHGAARSSRTRLYLTGYLLAVVVGVLIGGFAVRLHDAQQPTTPPAITPGSALGNDHSQSLTW